MAVVPFTVQENQRQSSSVCSQLQSESLSLFLQRGRQHPWPGTLTPSPAVRLQLSWKCLCLLFSASALFEMLGSPTASGNPPGRCMQWLIHLKVSLLPCSEGFIATTELNSVYAFRLLLQGHKAYFETSKIQFRGNLVTSAAREPTHESGKMASVQAKPVYNFQKKIIRP